VPDAVLVVEEDGTISYANDSASALFRAPTSQIMSMTVEDLMPSHLRSVHRSHRAGYAAAPTRRQMGSGLELVATRVDGSTVPVDIALSPVELEGRRCTIASIRDVTMRRQSEAELASARERLAILDDRERIARDLHDSIIQELFAAGLGLQTIIGRVDDPDVVARIETSIDRLEATITRLRNVIFDLRRPIEAGHLGSALEEVLRSAAIELGFDAKLDVEGDLDAVPPRVREHLVPTVREAVMNVAKHADASRITVAIDVGAELTLTVLDDGRGLVPAAGSGFGLANMRDRARTLGGTFTIEDRDGGGTAVVWSVPLIHGG